MPSAKILEAKKQAVEEIKATLTKAVAGVFVDYCGLTVEQDTKLRNKLREANVEYKVVKNTLTRFAANEIGLEGLDEILNGPTALAISETDEVIAAKVLAEFAKENEALEIKSGFLEGKVVSVDEVKKLADTPSREVLIAKLMGSMNSPIAALARTLQALVDNGVEPADIKVEKEEAPAAPEAVEAAPAEAAAEEAPAAE
ncbi:MAG: 50S ribosomal protein L10 [Clostridia bacterium]|nr:50S ribosomal protein L10 [Clostridia bacterium]